MQMAVRETEPFSIKEVGLKSDVLQTDMETVLSTEHPEFDE